MKLSREEVEHIAFLARLSLTEEEINTYGEQLSDILSHFTRLQKLDTHNITPMSSVVVPISPLREDTAYEGLDCIAALMNTNQKDQGQFKVPAVFSKSEGDQDNG
ncbi:MAG: Asp-tRNA(Asn)/Glu-tRNA(Gln) amidotransferase subunit GatC [Anaerolineales bacterium]|nr:Asp-tRNA(Asn)/Glu-tRNA(Gln) amidotransferase subunit GatC [Anaerolineales bacterium]